MLPADKRPSPLSCPECVSGSPLDRREFLRVLGTTTATAAVAGTTLTLLQKARAARVARQREAEALVFELYRTLDTDQKKKVVRPWDTRTPAGRPARLMTHNAAVDKDTVIGLGYDRKQVELLRRIFRAISNGEDGYRKLSRNNKFDNSGDFENIGAVIYGEPAEGQKFSLVFSGHHLTVRCDGDSEEKTAFGGPLYYGHSPSGYSPTNVFYSQTRIVTELYEALDPQQRKTAVRPGQWRDEHGTMKTPAKGDRPPGLSLADLTADQKTLVEQVMRELISPYRREDGDEVMELVKANGGLDAIHLAFYQEGQTSAKEPWTFWRLEGPGFVWSFRALPHIHTFVYVRGNL